MKTLKILYMSDCEKSTYQCNQLRFAIDEYEKRILLYNVLDENHKDIDCITLVFENLNKMLKASLLLTRTINTFETIIVIHADKIL